MVRAIEQLKRNKSPGSDYAMTAEVLKDGGEFIAHPLNGPPTFRKVWGSMNHPAEAFIIPRQSIQRLDCNTVLNY